MDQGSSTTSESESLDPPVEVVEMDYREVDSSESEESSSGETGFFSEECHKTIKTLSYNYNGALLNAKCLLNYIGKISNVYHNPNKKVRGFDTGDLLWMVKYQIGENHDESFLPVLARCWQINPDSMHSDDIEDVEENLEKEYEKKESRRRFGEDNMVTSLSMLALFTLKFKISSKLYRLAFKLLPYLKIEDQRLLLIISGNISKYNESIADIKKYQRKLKKMIKEMPFDEASIKVAGVIGFKLGKGQVSDQRQAQKRF